MFVLDILATGSLREKLSANREFLSRNLLAYNDRQVGNGGPRPAQQYATHWMPVAAQQTRELEGDKEGDPPPA